MFLLCDQLSLAISRVLDLQGASSRGASSRGRQASGGSLGVLRAEIKAWWAGRAGQSGPVQAASL